MKDTVLQFGKHKGKTLKELLTLDMDYLLWLACNCYKLRKEAQKTYENHIKSTFKKITDFKFIKSGIDQSLNFYVCVEVNSNYYTAYYPDFRKMEATFKPEQIKNVTLELHQHLFTNNYVSKSGKYPQWVNANRVYTLMPSVNIEFKNEK